MTRPRETKEVRLTRIDVSLVRQIEVAEKAGDEEIAAKLRRDRLENALVGFRINPRFGRPRRAAAAVREYEAAMAALEEEERRAKAFAAEALLRYETALNERR